MARKIIETLRDALTYKMLSPEMLAFKKPCCGADNKQKHMLEAVKSITSTKINIESVQTSFPLFDFTTRKEVVVKDRYSLDDADGNRKKRTNYYLFDHGSLGNVWSYKWDTSALKYYLNFM